MATIHEYYQQYWEDPESYNDPTTPQRQALLRRHLAGLTAGSLILDVGCGRGEFCEFFTGLGHRAEGIDISPNAIDYARQQHPSLTFHLGEIETLLPAREGAFDAIFSSEVIEHLFDVAAFLRCLHRLLRPGGTLVLTTPYHGLIKNLAIDLLNYSGHYDPLGQHIRFFDRRGLARCLAETGFAPRVWTGYGRPWPFWKSFFVVCGRIDKN